MQEFEVRFCSFQDIQEFVKLAEAEDFPILVGNDSYQVSGTSFMGMFSLNHSDALHVRMECSREEFEGFRRKVERLLVSN